MSRARDLAGIFNLNPLSGTTAQRPATAEVGEIYYNGTTGKTQIYTTTGWQDMASGIPYGNTAGRPAAVDGQPYFNGQEGRLELYTTSNGWQNIVPETPTVASIYGSYLESSSSNTIQITGTNFKTGAIAYAIGNNGVEVQASSTQVVSTVQINATFSGLSPAYEPYDIKVLNTNNLFGLAADVLYINNTPAWSTAAGNVGSFGELQNVSFTITATDPESQAITYSASGLPVWLSLNSSTGVISGTAPTANSATTYSFTATASDGSNTSSSRSFNIIVTPSNYFGSGADGIGSF